MSSENSTSHSADAFETRIPAEAINHALQMIRGGRLPSFFLETDDGPLPDETERSLVAINGLHGNVGSSEREGGRTLCETSVVTPCRRINGKEEAPRGQQVIENNRRRLEEIFGKVLQAGGRVIVRETTEQHRQWLDKVIAGGEE